MRVARPAGSMWMSLAPSWIAESSATFTRLTIGLPSTIRSSVEPATSSAASCSITSTSCCVSVRASCERKAPTSTPVLA